MARRLPRPTKLAAKAILFLGLLLIVHAAHAGDPPKPSRLAQAHIHTYIESLKQLYWSPGSRYAKVSTLSQSEVRRFAHLLYDAYAENPNAAIDSLGAFVHATKAIWSTRAEPKPGYLEYQIFGRVTKEISPLVYALIRTTYLLQVRVTGITDGVALDSVQAALHLNYSTLVHAVVERVFKGSQRFHALDTVTFYYGKGWATKNPPDYRIGGDYLVPMEMRDHDLLALVMFLDDAGGYYPVTGGMIQDPPGLFGQGATPSLDQIDAIIKLKTQELQSW